MLALLFSSFKIVSQKKKNIAILISIIVGILLSIYSSIIRSIPNYINRTRFAFWCMVPTFSFLVLLALTISLQKVLKKRWADAYETCYSVLIGLYTTSSIFYYLPLLITGTSMFVNYGESPVSTLVLLRIVGYALGLLVVTLTDFTVYKVVSKIESRAVHFLLSFSIFVFGITQCSTILLRLYQINIIPRSPAFFLIIAFIENHNELFIYALLFFTSIIPIILYLKNIKITESYANKAELRKLKAKKRNAKRWASSSLFFIITSFLSLSVLRFYIDQEIPLSPPEDYVIKDELAIIALETLEDDKLHRYKYISKDKIEMRFIAIKKSEGSYGIGLDACDICGPSGYFERGGEVVCKLCDVVMNKATIGFPGGCNPVPVPYILHDGAIKIKLEDLESEAYRFR